MGAILTRPDVNTETSDNVFIGMPFVEFAPKLGDGSFDSYRQLGIIETAAIAKEIEVAALRSAQSGTDKLVRELVRSFDARLNVGVFNFIDENMKLFFASSTLTTESALDFAQVDTLTLNSTDNFTWTDLTRDIKTWTSLAPAIVSLEAVGTGDGLSGSGAVAGDFTLDFKVNVLGDVASITVGGTAFAIVAGATAGDEVVVTVGTGVDSGELQFFTGTAVATDVTGDVVATYTPSFALTENTNYIVDYQNSRIRPINDAAEADTLVRPSQPVTASYVHGQLNASLIAPYTQFVFEGRVRVRHLTDVGVNIDWEIPLVNLRLTDDDFAWNRDEFSVGNLSVTMVDDGSATPFGTLRLFDENAA